MFNKILIGAAVLAAALCGCDREVIMSEKGFRLPEGDDVAGRQAFLDLQCHQCHTLRGTEFPQIHGLDAPYVELGGPVSRVKTYGELVTAIINPSHDLAKGYAEEVVSEAGESNMYNYNGYMTVQQLTDIVRFLQPHYEIVTPDVTFPVYP